MKIMIIGAGWIGCHLAKNLFKDNSITIFEEKDVFSSSSYYNQNRLHLGFHYSRNYKTRNLCKSTFKKFNNEYNFIIEDVPLNIYSIPENQSIIDYETYYSIFAYENYLLSKIDIADLKNISGSFLVNEKYINFNKAKNYFKKILSNNLIYKKIENHELDSLSKEYDLILNCTNNFIKDYQCNSFYELTLTLLFKKINTTSFDALTLVDGDFFSIYPYKDDLFTVTDVQHTPIFVSENIDDVLKKQKEITSDHVDNIKKLIIEKILYFYPDFNKNYIYSNYYLSVKSKRYDKSADRSPVININNNIISCFTGKIQGIYLVEEIVKNYIKNL